MTAIPDLPKFFDIEDNIEYEASQFLKRNLDFLDSPKAQQALRNAVLMLLELPEPSFNRTNVVRMLTDDEFRSGILKRLETSTPIIWSKDWNKNFKVTVHPLLSTSQERIVRLRSIMKYWNSEWNDFPSSFKQHLVTLASLIK